MSRQEKYDTSLTQGHGNIEYTITKAERDVKPKNRPQSVSWHLFEPNPDDHRQCKWCGRRNEGHPESL